MRKEIYIDVSDWYGLCNTFILKVDERVFKDIDNILLKSKNLYQGKFYLHPDVLSDSLKSNSELVAKLEDGVVGVLDLVEEYRDNNNIIFKLRLSSELDDICEISNVENKFKTIYLDWRIPQDRSSFELDSYKRKGAGVYIEDFKGDIIPFYKKLFGLLSQWSDSCGRWRSSNYESLSTKRSPKTKKYDKVRKFLGIRYFSRDDGIHFFLPLSYSKGFQHLEYKIKSKSKLWLLFRVLAETVRIWNSRHPIQDADIRRDNFAEEESHFSTFKFISYLMTALFSLIIGIVSSALVGIVILLIQNKLG